MEDGLEHGARLKVQPCAKVAFKQWGKREKHEPHTYFYSSPLSKITNEYQCPGRD